MSQGPAADVRGTVFEVDAPELTRNYAEALINAAGDGGVEAGLADLAAIVSDVLRAQPRFAELLVSPSLRAQDKDRILRQAFEDRVRPTVLRFLLVLNHHGRLA